MTIQYFGQTPRFSEATVANGFVFLAGMVPENSAANIYQQTCDVLAQIDVWLAKCGSDKNHLLEATIFLRDMSDYSEMNRAWDEWLNPQHSPARACVEAKLANPDWKVEIKVSAVQVDRT
ncbi:RidA family protein [Testudinibacter sp. TR-2022]|uniref:RidA family protein n=1 Tax=Testudinibacter sp. TR-2022 TaxID=2585029 RepID=UPI00111A7A35|nr:RidA family protein [Testudinibacter sp. TR-2022]TNH04078.1 RidA family protein [Pasteurellaceae bacterium Phil31]TNH09759.1 RidA family protein [Testudinibacter sp. TR-2022]TNH10978.1 RidA family protein [Testudinibacter sp. TR-2022]TNH14739.1 RidA family protein [Testudinibacter sp. TR-2022]TNH20556.1 RidA family protein [Testudinibacter sp. TR-2022]